MANKKKNEILEEQRRAREEFLKLKKMQKGELKAEPNPSEIALVPKTFKEKCENFWFQYKWHVIGITAAVTALVLLVAQCMSVPNYDFSVVYFTYTPAVDQQTALIADYFEKYGEDINGDGKVQVQVLNCSFPNEPSDIQYRNVQLQKLQAYIAGEYKAMLYITDEESIKYFDNIDDNESIFEGAPLELSEEFYKNTTLPEFGELPKGLTLSCRRIKDTILKDNDTAKATYTESLRLINELSENNK